MKKNLTIFLLSLVGVFGVCHAEKVTFMVKKLDKTYGDERVSVPVNSLLEGAEAYFSSAEVANLSPDYYDDTLVIRFGTQVDNLYPCGVVKFTLSPEFRARKVNKVSVKARLCNDYQGTNLAVYLYINGKNCGESVYDNDVKTLLSATLTYPGANQDKEYEQNDVMEICLANTLSASKWYTQDSQVYVYSITIDFEGEALKSDPEPVVIDPAEGIEDMEIGQKVSLVNCVVEECEDGYLAHVVRLDENERIMVENRAPVTYTIPVIWEDEEKAMDACIDIDGEIVEIGERKVLKILSSTKVEPQYQHFEPSITINGNPIGSDIIAASDRVEFHHPMGDNVVIYYVKRKDVAINPNAATIDPALITQTSLQKAPAKTQDETGTYIYKGPFRLVHPDDYEATNQNDLALSYQVHSAESLPAGNGIGPSDVFSIDNAITTGLSTLTAEDSHHVQYFNLLGLPVALPLPGQLLIQSNPRTGEKAIIVFR